MNTIFRIDDIGASAKEFEQHGKKWFKLFGKRIIYFPLANFWFFKRIHPFKRWAKYGELTAREWKSTLEVFEKHNVVPVVAVTATWVDQKGNLTPFPEKFPEEAQVLKESFHQGKIIVANHGLTHCVVGKHLPKFFGSNRSSWREFLPELSEEVHQDHILKSQSILDNYFEKPVTIFVPPGNVWSVKTYKALLGTNIKTVMSRGLPVDGKLPDDSGITFVADSQDVFAFHDRELKLYGTEWLKQKLKLYG
jgi:hypothetical protein